MEQMTNRQKKALETKEKIFACAVRLFAEKAYENVTVQDICTSAEVSVGAFYHHFKSKESILDEGYRLFDLQSEEQWNRSPRKEGKAAVCFLVECQASSMEKHGVPAALQYFKNQLSCQEKYILNPDRFFYKKIKESVIYEIQAEALDGNAHEITEDILAGTRGIIYDWCLHEGSYDLREKLLHIVDMVFFYYSIKK